MKWIYKIIDYLFRCKTDTISFLIGSGFSVADGMPLVSHINKRLRKITESEILIHTDRTAMFLNGQENENDWVNREQRYFVQEFLAFYCSEIIDSEEEFNYEEFFDYYSKFLREGYEDENNEINVFCDSFRAKHKSDFQNIMDNYNLVSHFHDTFNQLIAQLLQKAKYYENVTPLNYPPYDSFLNFLKEVVKENEIKVHTLNHDLLFERLMSVPPLWEEFTDGFNENGSPYYSQASTTQLGIQKTYRVRLRFFNNRYKGKICLYKLHGSVDTYQFDISNQLFDLTRVKSDYGVNPRFVKEIVDAKSKELTYARGLQHIYPDFLSGTTEKIRSYKNEYYGIIFNHFKSNLKKSKLLIVIGYGFNDSGVNEYLKKQYLRYGRKMVVISPSKPTSNLMDFNVGVIEKKMQDVTYDEFTSILNK